MNYYTTNTEILGAMGAIFDTNFPQNSKVNFAVSYSQHRRMSFVVIQIDGANFYHALILIYTKGLSLYDVVKYYRLNVRKFGTLSKLTPQITVLKDFIYKNIPKYSPLTNRKLKEDVAADKEDFRIDSLKSQIEQLKNKNKSYRNTISNLRSKISLLNKRNRRGV